MKPPTPTTERVPDLEVGARTHCGASRKVNEDRHGFAWFRTNDPGQSCGFLALVADGIGGRAAGEQASQVAVQTVLDYFHTKATNNPLSDLEEAIQQAHTSVRKSSLENHDLSGMGTTLAVVVVLGNWLHVASVGDSRVYLLRDQVIHKLTVDHTWAQQAVESGRLTPEAARVHPNRNVLIRYLGIIETVKVDLRVQPIAAQTPSETRGANQHQIAAADLQPVFLHSGDTIVLCTDGLSDYLNDQEIQRIVAGREVQKAADQLVDAARERGGVDDITTIVIRVPNQPASSSKRDRFAFLNRLKWSR